MNKFYLALVFLTFCLFSTDSFAVSASSSPSANDPTELVKKTKEDWNKMSKKERRIKRKEMKKSIKRAIKDYKSGASDEDTLLLVIITIFIPPLGMYLYEDEINRRFWLSLLLTLLFYVPGLIYTLVIILGKK